MNLTTDNLASLLRQASEAHHVYEAELGHSDAEWATWYAQWIAKHLTIFGLSEPIHAANCPTCGQGTVQPVYPAFPIKPVVSIHWKPLPSTVPLDAPNEADTALYGLSSYGVNSQGVK